MSTSSDASYALAEVARERAARLREQAALLESVDNVAKEEVEQEINRQLFAQAPLAGSTFNRAPLIQTPQQALMGSVNTPSTPSVNSLQQALQLTTKLLSTGKATFMRCLVVCHPLYTLLMLCLLPLQLCPPQCLTFLAT